MLFFLPGKERGESYDTGFGTYHSAVHLCRWRADRAEDQSSVFDSIKHCNPAAPQFLSGILPQTIIEDAQVTGFGNIIAGLLIVSLGTTIDFPELRRQWKVVVISLLCVSGAVAAIIGIGIPLVGRNMAISSAPIFAGGSAATLIMTTALDEKGLTTASTLCIALYVTQKFIGVPIASFLLRRTAGQFRENQALVAEYSGPHRSAVAPKQAARYNFLRRSPAHPYICQSWALVALAAHYASDLTGGTVHYFVMCPVMGVIFFALGFLEKGILAKTQADSLITFFVTILIFSNRRQSRRSR